MLSVDGPVAPKYLLQGPKLMSTEKTIHSFTDDALQDFDGVELARLIKAKEVSVEEVTAAAIARAKQVEPHLNAVEFEFYEQALRESQTLDQQGSLEGSSAFAGVPTFVKDNTPVAGMPTNQGSAAINSAPAKEHGPYAKQYLDQGFVVLGKSALPEFGFNATTEPAYKAATRNPWNTDFSSGASSGGAAALVAAGVVPLAHANDGGGSIRIPAACCGLVGLKPSRGRHIDSEQGKSLPVKIVSEGIVSRSVRDTAYFHAEAEKYYRNSRLPAIGLVEGPSKRRLKVAFSIDSITGSPTDAETAKVVREAAQLLSSLGHSVEEIPIPVRSSFTDDFGLYWSFLAFMTSKLGRYVVDPSFNASGLDGLTLGLAKKFQKSFYKIPAVIYRLSKDYEEYTKAFSSYDVMLTPVLARTPVQLGYLHPDQPFDQLFDRLVKYASFTPFANATGAPAISLPMGQTDRDVPISIHFSAHHGQEKTLLELAYELEAARPWKKIHSLETVEESLVS